MTSSGTIIWCDRFIRAGFFLLFALVPLLLTPWNYELFEYNKMMAVYGLTTIIIGSWVIKSLAEGKFRIAKTPLDIPILLFLCSQLISSLFSIDPHVSWFGYYSRFNGGMWSVICYALLYWAFVTNWTKDIIPLLKLTLTSAVIVAFYGVAERYGIDKHLWVQDVQNRVFSTLGQPNWLAAYLVALIPIAISFALKKNIFWIGSSILLFLVLLFTRSRSGLLAFAIADIFFWGLAYFKSAKEKQSHRSYLILLHVVFVVIVFVNGSNIAQLDKYFSLQGILKRNTTESSTDNYKAPLLESGGTESGIIRKYVWEGAMNAWKSSPKSMLIGTGTETYAFAFYQFRPAGHNLTSEWDFLYNKAHNEYLNYLATTGIFGLGSYVLLIGVFILWFIKYSPVSRIHVGLFAGWVSILVTNFFGFSVVILQLYLFLIPALLLVSTGFEFQNKNIPIRFNAKISKWVTLFSLICVLALLFLLSRMWYADTVFATGYRYNRASSYELARKDLTTAISLNSSEPFYRDELSTALAGLAVVAVESKDATRAATLAQESLRQSDIALSISPKNVNFWKSRTKIFYAFSSFDPQFNKAAVGTLEKALELSPNDPKIMYNLAILVGREAENEKAISLLKKAIEIKSNYRDAYWALAIFYEEIKQQDLAKTVLQEYLTKIDPTDGDFQEKLKQ